MQRCPSAPALQVPHPVSSLGSTKIWTHAHRGLAARLQEEPGPPVSPWGFCKEEVQAWPLWRGPPALLGRPPLRKCHHPVETLGRKRLQVAVCPNRPR